MKEDIYVRLRRHLDTFILGAPEAESILEILKIRFTPEEAEVALLLSQTPKDLAKIAESSKMNMEDLAAILDQMADKALVFKQKRTKECVTREVYRLMPTAVGLWETSFAKGEKTPQTEKLAAYWQEYYTNGWGKSMFTEDLAFTRVIPVGKSVSAQKEVYSYEKASELIKQQGYACVLHCPCRKSAELVGKGCGKPTEVCLHFGDLAKFFVEKGYAREVSLEDALEILDSTEKAGLIHMVGNSKQMGVAMCSCCTCCCTQFRAISEMQMPDAVAPSRFFAYVDENECTACETCTQRCLVGAITIVDDAAEVDEALCLGCGLCVTTCPVEAISLVERDSYRVPVDTGMELVTAFIKGKKK
jgi:electron transport complex protein RnfB